MNLSEFSFLADENIHSAVIAELRARAWKVRTVAEEGLLGAEDAAVLQRAHQQGRVLLTHDSDFGLLAIRQGLPFTGVLYVRPGHVKPALVLETIDAVQASDPVLEPPFLIVAERRADTVRVRIRRWAV